MGLSRSLLIHFRRFKTVDSIARCMYYYVCQLMDLNHGPPRSEATTLPTEPQPLPYKISFFNSIGIHWRFVESTNRLWNDLRIEISKHFMNLLTIELSWAADGWSQKFWCTAVMAFPVLTHMVHVMWCIAPTSLRKFLPFQSLTQSWLVCLHYALLSKHC